MYKLLFAIACSQSPNLSLNIEARCKASFEAVYSGSFDDILIGADYYHVSSSSNEGRTYLILGGIVPD